MRTLAFLLLFLTVGAGVADAAVMTRTFGTVAATASVTTAAVKVVRSSHVSVCWFFDPVATSGNVTMEVEGSIDGTNWATFGIVTVAITGPPVLVSRSLTVVGLGGSTTAAIGVPAPWIRLKLINSTTGQNLTNVMAAVMNLGD